MCGLSAFLNLCPLSLILLLLALIFSFLPSVFFFFFLFSVSQLTSTYSTVSGTCLFSKTGWMLPYNVKYDFSPLLLPLFWIVSSGDHWVHLNGQRLSYCRLARSNCSLICAAHSKTIKMLYNSTLYTLKKLEVCFLLFVYLNCGYELHLLSIIRYVP